MLTSQLSAVDHTTTKRQKKKLLQFKAIIVEKKGSWTQMEFVRRASYDKSNVFCRRNSSVVISRCQCWVLCGVFVQSNSSHSSVVTWRDQKICQHQKLILSEFLFVFLPIIMVSSTEVRHHFLYCCLHKPKKTHTISEVHLILKNVFLNCYISSSIYKLSSAIPHPLFPYKRIT